MDKLKVLENIRILSKVRKVPMSEIEKAAKASPGYIARVIAEFYTYKDSPDEKKDKNLPAADKMLAIAKKLGVSLDQLMEVDFSNKQDPEIAILMFLGNLKTSTDKNNLIWKSESLQTVCKTDTYCFMQNFPLRVKTSSDSENYDSFYSMFLDRPVLLINEGVLRLEHNGKTLLLVDVYDGDEMDLQNGADDCSFYYELYSVVSSKLNKIQSVRQARSYFDEDETDLEVAFNQLYKSAAKSAKVNPEGNDIVRLINDYMKHFGFED